MEIINSIFSIFRTIQIRDIVDIAIPNTVVCKDDSTEIMQKITPNYTFEEKELVWTWDDLTYEDIQNHFIDFKTEEEKILKEEI